MYMDQSENVLWNVDHHVLIYQYVDPDVISLHSTMVLYCSK